eukprot:TRINITY_DN80782_c0_g1_i1.p1 TRINITY_DN80782_c0_g1~~TRINITY_DN80782_c0_g1_i1.p1  ORF type:complete len:197 (-),score=42.70 TRINITY_DN80782_c0_g1_i1:36-551(-)
MAKQIGIDHVPEPNPILVDSSGEVDKFKEKYTAERVVRLILSAVNEHKSIKYQECLEYLESIRPEGVDAYAYLNEFVFDMDSGNFTERSIKYLLWTMEVIQLSPQGQKVAEVVDKRINIKTKGKDMRSKGSNRRGERNRDRATSTQNHLVVRTAAIFVGVCVLAFSLLYLM